MGRVSGKVALITGSSSGIGRTTALRLAEEGASVVVTYNGGRDRAEEVVGSIKSLGTDAIAVKADVTNGEEIGRMVDTAIKHFGRIDIYANCAGGHYPGHPLDKASLSEDYLYNLVIEVNLKGPFRCAAAIVPYMQAQRSGSIVFTSSTAKDGIMQAPDYKGLSHRVAYSSSKEGIVGMTRTMANYLAEYNIRVNCVVPGPITDDETTRGGKLLPLGRRGRTVEVANAILFLLSDEASFITSEILYVSGGFKGGGFNHMLVDLASS